MIVCGVAAIIMERKLDKVYEEISEENAERVNAFMKTMAHIAEQIGKLEEYSI